jgi:hypothetical protein
MTEHLINTANESITTKINELPYTKEEVSSETIDSLSNTYPYAYSLFKPVITHLVGKPFE